MDNNQFNNGNMNNVNNMNNGFNPNFVNKDNSVLSIGQWVLTIFVLSIPCVNIIMMFVWAFGAGNENRKNFCKASLIWAAIAIGIAVIFWIVVRVILVSTVSLYY